VVYDATGGIISGATITLTSAATGFCRSLRSNQAGHYDFASLAPGPYDLEAGAAGFQTVQLATVVSTGAVTTLDLRLHVGDRNETIRVDAGDQSMDLERHAIDQVIDRKQIQELPLNNRSFLQLAFLAPGVTVSSEHQGMVNRAVEVSVMGANPLTTLVTIDGARINDIVDGGTQQNFSQEIVAEFQISQLNFDLATGSNAYGAINIVTRTGGNQLHGSGLFVFRDHHMAAYPGLIRDPLAPTPYFARRQSGIWLGGPILKNRLFFFVAAEHNNQSGVFTSVPTDPAFSSLARVTSSPKRDNLFHVRLDYRMTAGNTAFVRYSHDGNDAFAPFDRNSMPSGWTRNVNWADSGVFSVTSVLRPALISELRYSNTFWSNRNNPPGADMCPDCIGVGGPQVIVEAAGVIFGNQSNTPQSRLTRRNAVAENITWQRGIHRMKWGGEIEFVRGGGTMTLYAPASMMLYSPQEVRRLEPALFALLPTTCRTLDDVLALPLKSFSFGVGDVNQPPSFQRDRADHDRLFHIYWQDTWKLNARLALNYGLAWSFESNGLNHDLSKPQLLAPIFGQANLEPESHDWKRISPAAGFAWTLPGNRTVIRGGAGIYYDTMTLEVRLRERAYLGPLGSGYLALPGSLVSNPVPGVPGVPAGAPLEFRSPTPFSAALLESILPMIRAGTVQALHVNPNNVDLSVRNIDLFKTAEDLFPRDFRAASAQHLSLGARRQFSPDLTAGVDLVFRHSIHEMLRGMDLNHYNSVAGPVIPKCSAATAQAPGILCSNGPIQGIVSGGNGHYLGLLARVEKRLSHRGALQFSYALASDINVYGIQQFNTPITNLDNWLQNTGPSSPRHVLSASGVVEIHGGIQISFISTFHSKPPFQPVITGADFYGTGIDTFLLPGSGTNRFNFGFGKSTLESLVNQYNSIFAGKQGPNPSQIFPAVTLPLSYSLGRVFNSQDVRVARTFRFGDRFQWQLFVESFNLLNTANLTGYANNLLDPGFGRPAARVSNTFGTGGARSFQVGTRLSF
jgi:hypothetical protein